MGVSDRCFKVHGSIPIICHLCCSIPIARKYVRIRRILLPRTVLFWMPQVEFVDQNQKFPMLIRTLNNLEATGLVLVFTETKRNADNLEYQLTEKGYPASSIHGDKTQREREDALRLFKTGTTPILVATDVAARGLDINNVTQVCLRARVGVVLFGDEVCFGGKLPQEG